MSTLAGRKRPALPRTRIGRPGSMLWFELSMYLWVGLQLWDAARAFRRGQGDLIVDGLILVVSLGVTWLIAWRRIGWLRWVLLPISVVCALIVTINVGAAFGEGLPLGEALPILAYFLLPAVAVSFTYWPAARAWLQRPETLPTR